jgi:hypothetical protein
MSDEHQPAAARSDQAIDQLLADGQLGGPALDAVWARVRSDLCADDPASASSVWQRLGARFGVAIAGLAAAAAVIVAVVLPGDDGLRARGGEQGAPVLEATCGSAAHPCRVGEPVFLRLHGAENDHRVDLSLMTRQGPMSLVSGLPVTADQTLAVPRKVRPELSDIDSGVIIEMIANPATGGEPVRYQLTLQVRE